MYFLFISFALLFNYLFIYLLSLTYFFYARMSWSQCDIFTCGQELQILTDMHN